jgi:predicted AAA+ superfamily ATPase
VPPFSRNLKKRIIKSPKLYFYDVGLATYLLGIRNKQQLFTHIAKGPLFENFIISELIKTKFNFNTQVDIYFYRDRQMKELDLVTYSSSGISAIEIKSARTFNTSMIRHLLKADKILNTKTKKILIYGGEIPQKYKDITIKPWNLWLSENLSSKN